MDRLSLEKSEARFAAFVESLSEAIGHRDRTGPLRDYCAGLLAGCERKSVEPLAAITAPARVSAQHQSLLHFVGKAPWSDEAVLGMVRKLTLPLLERHGPIEAWILDDTGFPKACPRESGEGQAFGWRGAAMLVPAEAGIAASSASKTIVKPRCRSRLPTGMEVFPSRTGFICPRNGSATWSEDGGQAYPAM